MKIELKQINLVPYNPGWPRMFEAEATLIRKALGSHCVEVYHIGSTSVPGLSAKDVLDVLCVVDKLDSSLPLQNFGYAFKRKKHIPLKHYFTKRMPHLNINLHVVEPGHGFIAINLCFRDYLRAHEDDRIAYAALKEQLLKDPKSYEQVDSRLMGYTLGKDEFIKNVLQKAGFNQFCVNFCNHDNEWETYHRIREEQIFTRINIIYDRNHPTLTADTHYHFVLYKGTKVVSVAHVELLNLKEAALRTLATDEPHKRHGYGTYMMHFLEKWLKHQGITIFKMHADLDAENLYRKLGYIDMPFDDPCIQDEYVNLGKLL